VWSILERLGVAALVDDVVGARRSDAAASVGTYIALACANRVVAPCSKLGFAEWWATTAGDRWVRVPAAALDHRRFWDAMHAIDTDALIQIERRLVDTMIGEFGVDLSGLVLDMTNFATYIDSGNEKADIAQRGHAKQKRADLRLVGLGLVVSTDGGIPICSHAYPGNKPDVTQFADIVTELTRRWKNMTEADDELTVVYDAGQDSEANQAHIEATGLHHIGSVPPSQFPELLAVAARRYKPVDPDRYPGLTAFDTRGVALGAERRLIVTHSPTLHAKQARGFAQTMAIASRRLAELSDRLAGRKTRKPRAGVEAEIARILKPRWLNRVITVTLTGEGPATFALTATVDPKAINTLAAELFGKRILFTDHNDWAVVDVVAGYRSQSDVENDFRQMKDPHVVSFSPMFHWTDHNIRVHAFYCVLALTVARLMRREAANAGMAMSVRELLDTLAGIQETVLLYPSKGGRPKARRMLTETNLTQNRLAELFGLHNYAPAQ
jgi:transposase